MCSHVEKGCIIDLFLFALSSVYMSAMSRADVRTVLSEVAECGVVRCAELTAAGQVFVSFVELELASWLEIRSSGRTRSAKVLSSSTIGDKDSGTCAFMLLLRSSAVGTAGGVSTPAAGNGSMGKRLSLPSAELAALKRSPPVEEAAASS